MHQNNSLTDINHNVIALCLSFAQSYSAINSSNGDLCVAIADMEIFDQIDKSYLASEFKRMSLPKVVLVDANISIQAFKTVGEYCKDNKIPLVHFNSFLITNYYNM